MSELSDTKNEMNLEQPVILKIRHIQSKLSQRAKKNVAVFSTSRPLNEKTIDDGKEKPQSIKFYNFTKGGTDIVDQLNAY